MLGLLKGGLIDWAVVYLACNAAARPISVCTDCPAHLFRPSGLHLGGNSRSISAATNDKLNLLLLLLSLTSPGMAAMLAASAIAKSAIETQKAA